jgi:hypothetical protein
MFVYFSLGLVRRPLLLVALLSFTACAEHAPPPPAHPAIEGNWEAVSFADIRACIAAVKQDFVRLGTSYPLYVVRVQDRNHIDVCYWPLRHLEECLHLERRGGSWKLMDYSTVRGAALAP